MNERTSIGKALLAVLIFGSVPALVGYVSVNAFTVGIVRLGFAVLITSFLFAKREKLAEIQRNEWKILLSIGFCFGFHWLAYFLAIKIGSASMAALGQTTYGIQLVILGWFFQLNALSKLDIVAVLLAMAGAILAIPELSIKSDQTISLILGILSGTFFACLPILHQKNSSLRWKHSNLVTVYFCAPCFHCCFFRGVPGIQDPLIGWCSFT